MVASEVGVGEGGGGGGGDAWIERRSEQTAMSMAEGAQEVVSNG